MNDPELKKAINGILAQKNKDNPKTISLLI
jgi:hypothetical protein